MLIQNLSLKPLLHNIPGRGRLRISLTPICNLKCFYCHNEKQPPPWLSENIHSSIESIDKLIKWSSNHQVKGVAFTGGEPGMYAHFEELSNIIPTLKSLYPDIVKWSITTNGIPFFNAKKYNQLIRAGFNQIKISIDSLYDNSKPFIYKERKKNNKIRFTENEYSGLDVFEKLVKPIQNDCDVDIKINIVFYGYDGAPLNVLLKCKELGLKAAVMELRLPAKHLEKEQEHMSERWKRFKQKVIDVFKLKQYINPITNELECDWISFYQDHCAEGICEYCRNVDFLVVTTKNGLEVLLPCYKEGKSMLIKTEDDFSKAVELYNI